MCEPGPLGTPVDQAVYTATTGVRSIILSTAANTTGTTAGNSTGNTTASVEVELAPAQFMALGCVVAEAHRQINCTTAPGAGANVVWRLSIDGLTSQSPVTSYSPPGLRALTMQSVRSGEVMVPPMDPVAALTSLSTEGGEVLMLRGDNFGPAAPASFVDGAWLLQCVGQ